MNKIILIFVSLCVTFSVARSQNNVGVNTNNPQNIFHVDAAGDNEKTTLTSAQKIRNDVIIKADAGEAVMSVGGNPVTSAQLTLADPNRALQLNRVYLTGANDIATVPNPQIGTLVYNMADAGTFPDNVYKGTNYFNGIRWYPFLSGSINSEIASLDLVTTLTTSASTLNNYGTAQKADFGTIDIPEDGYYTFSLKLYGTVNVSSQWSRTSLFVYLVNETGGTPTLENKLEINIPVFANGQGITYTAVLRGYFKKGDDVSLYIGHNGSGTVLPWSLVANPGNTPLKTSLIYWRG